MGFKLLFIATSLLTFSKIGFTQYLIEGQVNEVNGHYDAYLSILDKWDEFTTVSEDMFVKKVPVDINGSFRFEGTELPKDIGFYKIHFIRRGEAPVYISTSPDAKNFFLFLLSNQDSIHVEVENPLYSLGELSMESTLPANDELLGLIGDLDGFYLKVEEALTDNHRDLIIDERTRYVNNYIKTSDFGLVSLYGLYVAKLSIAENEKSFLFVEQQINEKEYRSGYHTSLESYIGSSLYKKLKKENFWLKIFLAILLLLIFMFAWKSFARKKNKEIVSFNSISKLSSKELEVFNLLLGEKSNQEIADYLFVTKATIKSHINSIYRKLVVNSRKELKALNQQRNQP